MKALGCPLLNVSTDLLLQIQTKEERRECLNEMLSRKVSLLFVYFSLLAGGRAVVAKNKQKVFTH